MLAGDSPFHAGQKRLMREALYGEKWHQEIKQFYEATTLKLLRQKTRKIAGVKQVDITRDIGNIVHTHFAANVLSLPLKTDENFRGIFSEHELYMMLAIVYVCVFFDLDLAKS